LLDNLNLELGGRVDRTDTSADPTLANTNLYFAYNSTTSTSAVDAFPSGSARLVYSMPLGLEISAGVGSVVRIPDAEERYFALRRAGSDWVGNPNLVASRNTGFDGSVSLRLRGLFASSSFFWNQVDNFIALASAAKVNPIPGIVNSNARTYQNVEASIYGTEVQLVYSFTSRLFLSSAMSYMRGTQEPEPSLNIFSTNLPEMPPVRSRTTLRYDIGSYWVEAEGVFAGPQDNVDTDLLETTPGRASTSTGFRWHSACTTFSTGSTMRTCPIIATPSAPEPGSTSPEETSSSTFPTAFEGDNSSCATCSPMRTKMRRRFSLRTAGSGSGS
jgi:iron complex outermembrane receptor protein